MTVYRICNEDEIATHVQILDTESNRDKLTTLNLEIGAIYEIFKDEEEDEDMIQSKDGEYFSAFPLYLDVEYMVKD